MESADAYAMLRIHCLPPSSDKQHDAAQGFFVDAPLLCSQLPLYLGRAKKGKEDKALRDFGLQAEAIRFPDSKSLLMAHRRTTLSKRQLQFDWDTANGCMVMTVCGNTAVSVDGQRCPQNSKLQLWDVALIVTAGIVIQFCPALPRAEGSTVPPQVAAAGAGAHVPSTSLGLPASTTTAQPLTGSSTPRAGGVKRPRSGAMRDELQAVLQQWKRRSSTSAEQELNKQDMLALLEEGGPSVLGGGGEEGDKQKKRLDRQVRALVKEGVLVKAKPSSGKVPARYRVA